MAEAEEEATTTLPTEDSILLQPDSHVVFTVPRKSFSRIPNTWFTENFPSNGDPPLLLPTRYDKESRPIYQIFIPQHTLEAFLQILQVPSLLKQYTFELPRPCEYCQKLDVWQLYLAEYFRIDIPLREGGLLQGKKRAREEVEEAKADEEKKDFSQPPKRFKRDYHDWEVLIALFDHILKQHPDHQSFEDGIHSTLKCIFGPQSTIPLNEKNILITKGMFIESKMDALKVAAGRVLNHHFHLEVDVKHFDFGTVREMTAYRYAAEGPLRGGIPTDAWPTNSPDFDDEVLVVTLEWKRWDGKCM